MSEQSSNQWHDQAMSQANDPQVDQIISKVLNHPIPKTHSSVVPKKVSQYQHCSHYHTSKVNQNLFQQNKQLRQSIQNLQNKMIRIQKSLVNKNKSLKVDATTIKNTDMYGNKCFQQENTLIEMLKSKITKAQQLSNKLSSRLLAESKALSKSNRSHMINTKKLLKFGAGKTVQTEMEISGANSPNAMLKQVTQVTSPIIMEYCDFEPQESTIKNEKKNKKLKQNIGTKGQNNKQYDKKQKKGETRQKQVQVDMENQLLQQQAQTLEKKKNQLEAIIKTNKLRLNLYQQKLQSLLL